MARTRRGILIADTPLRIHPGGPDSRPPPLEFTLGVLIAGPPLEFTLGVLIADPPLESTPWGPKKCKKKSLGVIGVIFDRLRAAIQNPQKKKSPKKKSQKKNPKKKSKKKNFFRKKKFQKKIFFAGQNAQNGPNGPKWPKMTKLAPNGPKWPQMTKMAKMAHNAQNGPKWSGSPAGFLLWRRQRSGWPAAHNVGGARAPSLYRKIRGKRPHNLK